RVEEPVLVRGLRPRRQAADRRPGRKLWPGATHVLQDEAGVGPARGGGLRLSGGGPLLGRRTPGPAAGDRGAARAGGHAPGCAQSTRDRRGRLRAVRSAAMIITRSPLRITLGGGGTDLPS